MKTPNWILRLLGCKAVNGSVRADEKRSPQGTEGGSLEEAKSVKRNEIPQKGQFNIMVGYGNRELPDKKSEFISSGAAVDFTWLYDSLVKSILTFLIGYLIGRLL